MNTHIAHAALFIDYENIYFFLKNRTDESTDSGETSISTVRNLKKNMLDERNLHCIVQHAYADFEKIGGTPQGAFYLMGIQTHFVLGTDHKNAADMQLCIDAMETLYTRPEIQTFIFVGGDRDYIPVVQHLRKHAKTVLVVSFRGSISGDLIQVAEERNFIDAAGVLPPGIILREEVKPVPKAVPAKAVVIQAPIPTPRPPVAPAPPRFERPVRLRSEEEVDALRIMLNHFGDKHEIWMSPYLHRQRAEMPSLAEYERRALINDLRANGAIAIEKRPGEQGEFSVILLNHDHPDVRELHPGA